MKIKHQLSIATLVMAGVFATGCSTSGGQQVSDGSQVAGGQQVSGGSQVAGGQQAAGGSQVAGGQQAAGGSQVAGGQQAAGGSQVAGGQQASGGQQVGDTQIPVTVVPKAVAPVMVKPAPRMVKPAVKRTPKPMQKPKQVARPKPRAAGNCHGHARSKLTKVAKHCHKSPGQHSHNRKAAPARKRAVMQKAAAPRVITKTVYKSVPKIIYKDRVIYKPVYKTKTVVRDKPVYKTVVKTKTVYVPRAAAPVKRAPARRAAPRRNPLCHGHAGNRMTRSVQHCHKSARTSHNHQYGAKRAPARRAAAPARRAAAPVRRAAAPVRRAPARPVNRNPWCHNHAANGLTRSSNHCHKYSQRNHSHMYGQKVAQRRAAAPAPRAAAPAFVAPVAPKQPTVDVFALQQKLKAKGYYRGPIDGVVGSGTRSALQQFMQNRN